MRSPPAVPPDQASYPLRPGNQITPWIDGQAFYERLQQVLVAARHTVWTAVSFIQPDFRFPDGESLWDVLDACVERGVDVRLLFWHSHHFPKGGLFLGDARLLRERQPKWCARWDGSGEDRPHCHHQKTWMIDAGQKIEIAFVGGMVLTQSTVQSPAHSRRPDSKHDLFVELRGPAARDVAHNFVQRWNGADQPTDAPPWPDAATANDLPLPTDPGPARGDADVQISRTVKAGLYGLEQGETSVWLQYQAAFAAARRTIYIENQHPGEQVLLGLLDEALTRGVRVVYVVPGAPMTAIVHAKRAADAGHSPRYAETFARLGALGRHPNFVLAALAVDWDADQHPGAARYAEIYTHGKIAIVDGAWVTCGSANLVDLSLHADHTELNAAFWHAPTALELLYTLVYEHTGTPSGSDDDRFLVEAFQRVARENARRRSRRDPLQGRCYAIDPAAYPRTARDQALAVD